MSWKSFIINYLTFSRKERIAVFLFAGLFLLLAVWPYFMPKAEGIPVKEDTSLSKLLDSATRLAHETSIEKPENDVTHYQYEASGNSDFTAGELFLFDPNTLPAAGWRKLGLRERTIKTILNYRNKGGRFYRHEDLKKIWGLPAGFYDRVQDYIRLPEKENLTVATTNNLKSAYPKAERRIAIVDVNNADTGLLIALPGIGSKLANRIVAFREKLGGFHSPEQLQETYGLPDSTFQKLKPYLQAQGAVKKININTATKEELKTHPYIKWTLANAIVEYRNQHGHFKNLEELKHIVLIDDAVYHRMAPYLSL